MKRLTINFTLESGKNLFIEKVLHFRLNVFQWGKEKKNKRKIRREIHKENRK